MSRKCQYCGNELRDGDNFCQSCGAVAENEVSNNNQIHQTNNSVQQTNVQATQSNIKTQQAAQSNTKTQQVNAQATSTQTQQVNAQAQQANTRKTNGMAITSFVCSLIGLIIFGIPLGVASIGLASTAIKSINSCPGEKGKGLAIAGLVIGILDVVLVAVGRIIAAAI